MEKVHHRAAEHEEKSSPSFYRGLLASRSCLVALSLSVYLYVRAHAHSSGYPHRQARANSRLHANLSARKPSHRLAISATPVDFSRPRPASTRSHNTRLRARFEDVLFLSPRLAGHSNDLYRDRSLEKRESHGPRSNVALSADPGTR